MSGVVRGTAGGPYCGICGAPVDVDTVAIPAYPGDFTTVPGMISCPNGCDPRQARISRP